MSWNGYWDKYGIAWAKNINRLNTIPEEIIIVSDKEVDASFITITKNVKNIVSLPKSGQTAAAYYRNLAVSHSRSDWIVASDLDDLPFPTYLDNLDDSADIHAFSFVEGSKTYHPDEHSLLDRLNGTSGSNLIPGTSAIKKNFFKNIRYENSCDEDQVFYSMSHPLSPSVAFDSSIRFSYSGRHGNDLAEGRRVSKIYQNIITGDDRSLYVFWFSNKISKNRKSAIKILAKECHVNLKIITRDSFYKYNQPEMPIHLAFKYLSDVHKSAYARAYMMYFYGGGYSDIKANSFDWNVYFNILISSSYDAIGYPEKHIEAVAPFWNKDRELFNKVSSLAENFAGNGHYIFKPKTVTAAAWLEALHKILDEKMKNLLANPGLYHPYAVYGGVHQSHKDHGKFSNSRYPIEWNEINGRILQKIQYEKNFSSFLLEMPHPNVNNYR
jgi:hypothetical protein